jgi:amino acid transporter
MTLRELLNTTYVYIACLLIFYVEYLVKVSFFPILLFAVFIVFLLYNFTKKYFISDTDEKVQRKFKKKMQAWGEKRKKGIMYFIFFNGAFFTVFVVSLLFIRDYIGGYNVFKWDKLWSIIPAVLTGLYVGWKIEENKYQKYLSQNSEVDQK